MAGKIRTTLGDSLVPLHARSCRITQGAERERARISSGARSWPTIGALEEESNREHARLGARRQFLYNARAVERRILAAAPPTCAVLDVTPSRVTLAGAIYV